MVARMSNPDIPRMLELHDKLAVQRDNLRAERDALVRALWENNAVLMMSIPQPELRKAAINQAEILFADHPEWI